MPSFTSHYAFRGLYLDRQCAAIWDEGRFVATRYAGADAVNLYDMPGRFFAEVFFDQLQNVITRTNTFTSSEYLYRHYAAWVPLPPEWDARA